METKVTSLGEILFDIYTDNKKLGGAPFNFIYHIIKLTGKGNLVSRIGNDKNGEDILQFLNSSEISTEFIQIDSKHPTGTAKPVLSENKIPRWQITTGTAYDYIEDSTAINRLIENDTDCLYFGSLAQRGKQTRDTLHTYFGRDIKYFCDLNIRQKFYDREILETSIKASDVLKLNIDELKLVNRLMYDGEFDFEKSSLQLKDDFNIDLLCITLGGEGSVLFYKDKIHSHSVHEKNVIDTVGAGDAFAALLCIGYFSGWDIERINRTASEFASEIVQIHGALPDNDSIYEKFVTKLEA